MAEHYWLGMLVIFISGLFNGIFALPMKYSRDWRWENTWFAFSVVGILALPWVLAYAFVPNLVEVYRAVPVRILLLPLIFGFLWGFAQTTYGLSLNAVGLALAVSIVSGLAVVSGSLVPLLVLNPADILRSRGILLLCSLPLLILGLVLYGVAGRRREREQQATGSTKSVSGHSFKVGLALCIFTGVFGSTFNLGYAFSGDIIKASLQSGAGPATAGSSVWCLVFGAGFFPNFFYCLYLLKRNRTFPIFHQGRWVKDALLAVAMAVLWLSGLLLYGAGAIWAGKYGTSIGFTLFIATSILSSSAVGLLAGEWRSTSARSKRLLAGGLALTLLAIVVLNLGGLF